MTERLKHKNLEDDIFLKNIRFDERLKKEGLADFERKSNYINRYTDVKIFHTNCGNEFFIKPRYFFNKERKCPHCLTEEFINKKNRVFDNKLKKRGLVDFIRKSDYVDIDTEIKLLHIKCRREISVKPKYFFKQKKKCPHCYKKESKNRTRAIPKNEFYQNKIDILTNKEFILLSDYYNLNSYIKLKHIKCGHVFETRADSFEKRKNKCPNCSDIKKHYNKTVLQKVKELEDLIGSQYEILDRGFNYNDNILIKHKSCGHTFKLNVASITKFKNKKRVQILCPKCNAEDRKESFLDNLDRIQGPDIKLKGAYKGALTPTKFYHKKCNKTFVTKPYYLLRRKMETCPECRNDSQQENFLKKLNSLHGDKFELVGSYNGYDNKVRLKHKSCGSIFDIFPSNLFEKRNPCRECSKKEILLEKNKQYKKKIKNLYKGKFNLIGEALGVKYEAEFLCNSCGNTFKEKLETVLRGKKKCPNCKN